MISFFCSVFLINQVARNCRVGRAGVQATDLASLEFATFCFVDKHTNHQTVVSPVKNLTLITCGLFLLCIFNILMLFVFSCHVNNFFFSGQQGACQGDRSTKIRVV